MRKPVDDFYNVQWGSPQAISEYNLFLTLFDSALQKSYKLLGDLHGKKILEIGAGSGQQAFYFAFQGAKVTAIDISEQSLRAIKKEINSRKIKNLDLRLMNAENITFADDTFDIIYINSVLMHVHKGTVLKHCKRVLKRGGRLIILEPIAGNPLLTLVRRFSKYQSMNPQYMTLQIFKQHSPYFSSFHHYEFYLFSWFFFPVYKLINNKRFILFFQKIIGAVEQSIIYLIPPLRSWCWVTVAVYQK